MKAEDMKVGLAYGDDEGVCIIYRITDNYTCYCYFAGRVPVFNSVRRELTIRHTIRLL